MYANVCKCMYVWTCWDMFERTCATFTVIHLVFTHGLVSKPGWRNTFQTEYQHIKIFWLQSLSLGFPASENNKFPGCKTSNCCMTRFLCKVFANAATPNLAVQWGHGMTPLDFDPRKHSGSTGSTRGTARWLGDLVVVQCQVLQSTILLQRLG